MNQLRRLLSILLASTLIAASSGCARVAPGRLPDPPSEDLRARMGRIGVTWSTSGDSLHGAVPPKGSCDGAGRGAVAGMLLDLKITGGLVAGSAAAGEAAPFLAAGFLGLGLAMLPVSALIGSLYGAAAAPDPRVVEEAIESLQRAIDAREFPRRVAEAILERARVAVDDPLERLQPGSPQNGFDTLLIVDAPQLVLAGPYNVNPALQLVVLQTASLVRTSDGQMLHRLTLVHAMPQHTPFLEWAKNDAELLRRSLDSVDHALGARLLDEMFLVHALPMDREWKPVKP